MWNSHSCTFIAPICRLQKKKKRLQISDKDTVKDYDSRLNAKVNKDFFES